MGISKAKARTFVLSIQSLETEHLLTVRHQHLCRRERAGLHSSLRSGVSAITLVKEENKKAETGPQRSPPLFLHTTSRTCVSWVETPDDEATSGEEVSRRTAVCRASCPPLNQTTSLGCRHRMPPNILSLIEIAVSNNDLHPVRSALHQGPFLSDAGSSPVEDAVFGRDLTELNIVF